MKKKFYITTPLFYPSSELHIGHLYTATIASVIKNFKELQGYEVLLATGIDEHGKKIANIAKKNNISTEEYTEKMYLKTIKLWKVFGINYDLFIRTSDNFHHQYLNEVFAYFLKNNFVEKGVYEGLYSVEDEEFVTLSQAKKIGNQYFHPISNHQLEPIKEKTYFFKMNIFEKWLNKFYEDHKDFLNAPKFFNELKNNFLNKGIKHLSITREKLKWGIHCSYDQKQTFYVWFDALFGYLSALEKNYPNFWTNAKAIHVIGKEISRFHCIYWPIFLKAYQKKLPDKIFIHGWIVTPEGKMSKSKGNVINPMNLLKDFDAEVIKCFLLFRNNLVEDGTFTKEQLVNFYNAQIVNNFANLISRTVAMINQNFKTPVKYTNKNTQIDQDVLKKIVVFSEHFKQEMEKLAIYEAVQIPFKLSDQLNKYIDLTKPWTLKNNKERLSKILNTLLNGIYAILTLLKIFMPINVKKFQTFLNINKLEIRLISDFKKFDNIYVKENQLFFKRIKISQK